MHVRTVRVVCPLRSIGFAKFFLIFLIGPIDLHAIFVGVVIEDKQKIVKCDPVIRLRVNCLAQCMQSFFNFAMGIEYATEVIPGFSEVRLVLQCPLKAFVGQMNVSIGVVGQPQIVERFGIVWLDGNCGEQRGNGLQCLA